MYKRKVMLWCCSIVTYVYLDGSSSGPIELQLWFSYSLTGNLREPRKLAVEYIMILSLIFNNSVCIVNNPLSCYIGAIKFVDIENVFAFIVRFLVESVK